MNDGIAIIGLIGRFPDAEHVDQLWENLAAGRECIRFFADQELADAGLSTDTVGDRRYIPARGTYERPLAFDARFFGFTPREAEMIDPQHRIFLECCWEALETAGYDPHQYSGRIGVFAGCGPNRHRWRLAAHPAHVNTPALVASVANDSDYLCTRVGYKLNLRGPCVGIQTACSTGLVSVVAACQSLAAGDADMALAGGVSVHPDPVAGYWYAQESLMSPDGHCRPFDAAARGTVFSSGVGVVVLKRLADARQDRDHIHAIIRGYSVSNDAGARAFFSAAGAAGQEAAVRQAIAMSGLRPDDITYIECHGTGTAVGDPVELRALMSAFRGASARKRFCAIGSIKSNIGHTDAAAGIAGLTKVVLAMHHRQIPASINYSTPNPHVPLDESPFFVNSALRDWTSAGPRRAGVSSFGMGGTNAHVVLEESPPLAIADRRTPPQLLIWSARTASALTAATDRLMTYLASHPATNLGDVAFTLMAGRHSFDHRRWVVSDSTSGAVNALAAETYETTVVSRSRAPQVVFVCAGKASTPAVLEECRAAFGVFRRAFDDCVDQCRARVEAELGPEFLAFAESYALCQLWIAWVGRPQAVIGCGVGEEVAACIGGTLSLTDAIARVCGRLDPARPLAAPTWSQSLASLPVDGQTIFVSIGPTDSSFAPLVPTDALVAADVGSTTGEASAHRALLGQLGRLWARGVALNGAAVCADSDPRRTALPTYPFERQDFGISRREYLSLTRRAPSAVDTGDRADEQSPVRTPVWQRVPAGPSGGLDGGPWVVFADDEPAHEEVWDDWTEGHDVIRVVPGFAFAIDGDRYVLRPSLEDDYHALFRSLIATGRTPTQIVVVSGSSSMAHDLALVAQCAATACGTRALTVTCIADGAFEVIGSDQPTPAQAGLAESFGAVLHRCPAWRFRVIDVGRAGGSRPGAIRHELATSPSAPVVCFRAGYRWTLIFDRHAPARAARIRVNPRPSLCLIVDSSSSAGIAAARALAESVASKVVVVQVQPERGHSSAALRQMLDTICTGESRATGIVDLLDLEESSQPRSVDETRQRCTLLQDVARQYQLRWLVIGSSLGVIAPMASTGVAAARTAALDAFARSWPESSHGRIARLSADPACDAALVAAAIVEAIEAAGAVTGRQLIVSTREPSAWIVAPSASSAAESREVSSAELAASRMRFGLATTYVAPRTSIETTMVALWEALFGLAPIGIHDDFLALGGHSLLSIQLASRLLDAFGCEFTASELLKHPTIEQTAELLIEKLALQLGEVEHEA